MSKRLAEENRRTKKPWMFAAMAAVFVGAFLVITSAVEWNVYSIRTATKWSMRSELYKSEVLAQSGGRSGEFKHIEWDGWGWAGQNTTVYLVFDSTDSLSAAAATGAPGKYNGIPCEVAQVRQLESCWYAVQFYTDESWGRHYRLDCRGSGN